MRSLRDAAALYRTLVGEALENFGYSEKGEALGRRLDVLACNWGYKVRPEPTTTAQPLGPEWQDIGWVDEDWIQDRQPRVLLDDIRSPLAAIMAAQVDRIREPSAPPPEWARKPASEWAISDETEKSIAEGLEAAEPIQRAINDMRISLLAAGRGAYRQKFMAGMTSEDYLREHERPMVEHVRKLQEREREVWQQVIGSFHGVPISQALSDLDVTVNDITPNDESKDTPHDDDPDSR